MSLGIRHAHDPLLHLVVIGVYGQSGGWEFQILHDFVAGMNSGKGGLHPLGRPGGIADQEDPFVGVQSGAGEDIERLRKVVKSAQFGVTTDFGPVSLRLATMGSTR